MNKRQSVHGLAYTLCIAHISLEWLARLEMRHCHHNYARVTLSESMSLQTDFSKNGIKNRIGTLTPPLFFIWMQFKCTVLFNGCRWRLVEIFNYCLKLVILSPSVSWHYLYAIVCMTLFFMTLFVWHGLYDNVCMTLFVWRCLYNVFLNFIFLYIF